MKKRVLACLLVGTMFLLAAGCGKKTTVEHEDEASSTVSTEDTTEEESTSNTSEEGFTYTDLAKYSYDYSSGAGGWATYLNINEDGTFNGDYHDSEIGDMGDDYPNGSVYLCKFTGSFDSLEKVDDTTYKTTVKELSLENEVDTEEILDSVRYVYTSANGLNEGDVLYFYLPGSKVADLPEEFINWVTMKAELDENTEELSFVGIYNESDGSGFSGYDLKTAYLTNFTYVEQQSEDLLYALQHEDMSQTEYNTKYGDLYTLWDDDLNYLWSVLKATLPEDEMATLTKEEKAWIAEKEEKMNAEAEKYAGGSMEAMVYNQKGAELTEARVRELQKYLD